MIDGLFMFVHQVFSFLLHSFTVDEGGLPKMKEVHKIHLREYQNT